MLIKSRQGSDQHTPATDRTPPLSTTTPGGEGRVVQALDEGSFHLKLVDASAMFAHSKGRMRTFLQPKFWTWAVLLWWYAPSVLFFIVGRSANW